MKKRLLFLLATVITTIAMAAMVSAATITSTVSVPTAMSVSGKVITKTYSFDQGNTLPSITSENFGIVIPITISEPGTLELTAEALNLEKNISIELYTDAQCENSVFKSFMYITEAGSANVKYIALTGKGTYYMKAQSTQWGGTPLFSNSFKVSMRLFPRGERTIKSGQTISYYRGSGGDEYLFKYKAEKTGKATVRFSYDSGSYLTLLDSNRKELSNEIFVSDYINNKYTFAVKKGTTYYFKVKSNGVNGASSVGNGNFQTIYVKNTAVSAKAGKSRKKAVSIKYNKTIKGLIVPGDRSARWYRITLKKGKKPAFILNGDITGVVNVKVLNKKGKVITTDVWKGGKWQYNAWRTWKPGTYYIKITRTNALSSGCFTIKNKQVKSN